MAVRAIPPSSTHRLAFLAMLDDFAEHDPHNTDYYAPARDDFEAYVRSLIDEERGLNLRDGWVPCTHRWLVTSDNAVAGVTRLRHCLDTPFLLQDGGRIGYDVAPAYRGRSYGHIALRVSLQEAARRGISRVLLYASEDNPASRAVIERAGGVLGSVAYSEFWKERVCKYWLSVNSEG